VVFPYGSNLDDSQPPIHSPQTMRPRESYVFGPFDLSADRRELRCRDVPVQLGSRAIDLLLALVRRQGELAAKDELMEEVWPGTVVEENNLKVHVSALRKALGTEPEYSRCLLTVPGRGYRFVAQVDHRRQEARLDKAHTPLEPVTPLPLPDKPSIAVLPFTNMSVEPEEDYFADGIAEDIITALARFPSLFVIARNSTFTYKGRAVDVRRVGRELGVRYVLEGSVRRFANRVRITSQLVQAETGVHIWADRYEDALDDIFALQDEMTTSIVGALLPGLERAEIERVRLKPPDSLNAYDCYLRAMAAYYTWTNEGSAQALRFLDQAFKHDPHFVPAVILAENCWSLRYTRGWSPAAKALAESERLARLAVKLDPENAEALAILARRMASINHDYEEAVSVAQRAVESNPNSSFAWRHSGWAYAFAGRPQEALAHFERALRLSPREALIHDVASPLNGMALALIQLERDAEAVGMARKSIQQNPESAGAWRMLAAALALTGQLEQARAAFERVRVLDPECTIQSLYLRFGHSESARARFYEGLRKAGMPEEGLISSDFA
jgi:TolB-like protein/tetratricopeptide (TPR) repeat protein